MEKQAESQRIRETRKIIVISDKTRKEVDAMVLGSMGCAPAKERHCMPAIAIFASAYSAAGR